MKPLMSDAEIRRRKKLQGKTTQATSTLGLTGLGLIGAAAYKGGKLKKIPQQIRGITPEKIRQVPKKVKNASPEQLRNAAVTTGIVSGGIGGVSGYNFAAYTRAESRKKKAMTQPKKPVAKRDEMAPVFGEVAKAWTAMAKPYDSEAKRARRADVYQAGAGGVAGASLAGAAITAGQAGDARVRAKKGEKKKFKTRAYEAPRPKKVPVGPLTRRQTAWQKGQVTRNAGKPVKSKKQIKHEGKVKALHQMSRKNIKTSGKLAAVGAAAVGTHEFVRHQKKRATWAPYSKRDTLSAFGVDHMPDVEWTAP